MISFPHEPVLDFFPILLCLVLDKSFWLLVHCPMRLQLMHLFLLQLEFLLLFTFLFLLLVFFPFYKVINFPLHRPGFFVNFRLPCEALHFFFLEHLLSKFFSPLQLFVVTFRLDQVVLKAVYLSPVHDIWVMGIGKHALSTRRGMRLAPGFLVASLQCCLVVWGDKLHRFSK